MTHNFLPNLKLYMWELKRGQGVFFMLRACGWGSPAGMQCAVRIVHFFVIFLCFVRLNVEVWSAQGHLTSSAGTQPDPDHLSYLSGTPQTAPPSPHFPSFRAYRCLQLTLFPVQSNRGWLHFKVILRHAVLSLD